MNEVEEKTSTYVVKGMAKSNMWVRRYEIQGNRPAEQVLKASAKLLFGRQVAAKVCRTLCAEDESSKLAMQARRSHLMEQVNFTSGRRARATMCCGMMMVEWLRHVIH